MVAANRLCLTCGIEYNEPISVCPKDQTRLTVLAKDERVGTVLADRYDILEIIGTGGMGTVYKARQRLINRIVAVKMLHKTMMASADVLRRFQLEAQAASRLSLPNILTIYDFGLTEEGQPYMVMDYLNGTSLDKIILNQHHLEPIRALNIFIQACAALAHAHQHGVLHRDIKPSNIMLINFDDQSDFVKIVDFGIAKMMNKIEGQAAELTKTGEVYGSPPYMSPEQCRGLDLDNRADIYSLACVLYKSLVGKNPMPSDGDSMPLQIMLKHINERAPSFAEAAPELFLSNKLEAVVFKALEKNPDERYQTMLEFKEALEKVRDTLIAESRAAQIKAQNLAQSVIEPQMTTTQNLSPSEFLSTLNSQLTESALATNSKAALQPVASPLSNNAQSIETFFQTAPEASIQQSAASSVPSTGQPQRQPSSVQSNHAAPLPVPNSGVSSIALNPQPADLQSPTQNAVELIPTQPTQPLARATFAEALQATLPNADTQMLSIVQTPHTAITQTKAGQAIVPAENPPDGRNSMQDRRAKSLSQELLPAQPNLQNQPTGAEVPGAQNIHATIAANLQHAPRVSTASTPYSKAKISQTLKEMPAVDVNLQDTPVLPKIPASVLDEIKTPNIKAIKISHDTAPSSAITEKAQVSAGRGNLDKAPNNVDRPQRLGENRLKFIKHETDSSKTMLVIAGLALVIILSAFFSFSYFNGLTKQSQTAQVVRGQDQTTAGDQKALDSSNSAVDLTNEVKPTDTAGTQSRKPTMSDGNTDSAANAAKKVAKNAASENNYAKTVASVTPVNPRTHKAHKIHAVTPAHTSASSGVRRHAYSSYGMSY